MPDLFNKPAPVSAGVPDPVTFTRGVESGFKRTAMAIKQARIVAKSMFANYAAASGADPIEAFTANTVTGLTKDDLEHLDRLLKTIYNRYVSDKDKIVDDTPEVTLTF